jgi:hypothetical protein
MKLPIQRLLALLVCVQGVVAFPASAEESILCPDSVNIDADWALSRVGMNFPNAPANSYAYPDTTVPVRLYLIDTGVTVPTDIASVYPKITFEGSIPVGGTVSVPRSHGTQMLSLIAGKDTGSASGTPIHVVNYDIYTSGDAITTTTITNLAKAIGDAVKHHRHPDTSKMRAAICIATSSQTMTKSFAVEDSINQALAAGIPVIVSAGNLGQEIPSLNFTATSYSTNSSYLPSAYGTKEGVICVGSSDANDLLLSTSNSPPGSRSNFGDPVDILAPGLNVRTSPSNSPLVTMTGTSPATALVAGSVLAELSINGSLTPAQVESAIVPATGPKLLRTSYASTVTIINPDGPVIASDDPQSLSATTQLSGPLAMSASSIQGGEAITPSVDADSDGIPDMIEIFHNGCCTKIPAPPVLSLTANNEVEYKFPIAFDLFRRATPFELGNGYTWGIRRTSNFESWAVPEGSLSKTTDANGQCWLIATFPAGTPSCFVQIEIHPPAAALPAN